MHDLASESESGFRTMFVLMFAFLALFVASIGLYGVMSYSVTRRTREFGIRMAIGATRGAVRRAVLARAARFVCIGMCPRNCRSAGPYAPHLLSPVRDHTLRHFCFQKRSRAFDRYRIHSQLHTCPASFEHQPDGRFAV